MQFDIKQILDFGFTVFFGVMVIITVFKYIPSMTDAWYKLSGSIDKNTDVTNKHFDHSKTFLEELRDLKLKLEQHDENAHTVRENQDEIMAILEEIKEDIAKVRD